MASPGCDSRAALAAFAFSTLLCACGESFSTAAPATDALPEGQPSEAGTGGQAGADSARGGDTGATRDALMTNDAVSDDALAGPNIPTNGLVLWLRADRGVTEEAGQVAAWTDQSGNDSHATQTATNVRPKLLSAGIGGRPSILFDGIDDFLKLPPAFADFSLGISVFATIQYAAASACTAVVELSNGSEVDDISFGQFENRLYYEVLTEFSQGSDLVTSAPQVIAVVHQPNGSFEMRQNTQLSGGGSMTLPDTIVRQQNFVGRSLYANCVTFPGNISELLIYERAVNDTELVAIESHLRAQANCCTP